ncbi:putative thymidylate synthase [Roseibium sp. TrichSKD4]|uniref:hypothetical protein n=1 Tax=Roseibium sp. TrichSKD4 TaxID=744980 RepID=UPI0001E5732B|nr:hypothetical protein [Roseibium sp. TrichSKD4]EFO29131.1 putative thymidylate synthase [Roseibium sp. TrichSKD4]
MLEISTPATLLDMAELGGGKTRVHWAILREMRDGGKTWAFRNEGELIGIAGLYPITGDAWEAWFNLKPEMGGHLDQMFRAIRLTLQSGDYPEIIVICTSRAGKIMARRMGFSFAETCDAGEIWKWVKSSEAVAATRQQPSQKRTRKSNSAAV